MRALILIVVVFGGLSCASTGMLKKVKPTCITWQGAIGEILPDQYFVKQDTQTWLGGNLINPSLEVCVYKCSDDIYVVLEEDWNTTLNELGKPVKYFNSIYVLDQQVAHTSFPQGYNHKVIQQGNEIKIHLCYLYRTEFDVQLIYKEGEIKTVKQKGSFKN